MIQEKATIGAGCFWHIEEFYSYKRGVLSTCVGYMGGNTPNPNYKTVCSGSTRYAEVTQIIFNPNIISYKRIIDFFWRIHNPCSLNKQGLDVGTQYRSVIFFHSKSQQKECLKQKEFLEKKNFLPGKIVTEIVKATKFYKAEEYHQKYFKKNHIDAHSKIPKFD